MSSHHFVKEQQEPALVILSTSGLGFDQVAPLLEWSPTVMVAQDAIHTVISWGIKVDFILADMDFQVVNYHLLEEQYPVKFLGVANGNFLEEALQYLIASKHSAVNVLGYDSGKLDALEPKLEFLDIVVHEAGIRYLPVKSGHFRKWFTPTELVLIGRQGGHVTFTQEASSKEIILGGIVSIAVEQGFCELQAEGIFWIGEKLS